MHTKVSADPYQSVSRSIPDFQKNMNVPRKLVLALDQAAATEFAFALLFDCANEHGDLLPN